MSEVSREIRRRRIEKGWTQAELAVYSHMSPSSVSLLESGERNPSGKSLQKIASALGVEVADLFPKAESPLPLDFEQQGATSVEGFEDRIQNLNLDALNQLGRELAAEHRAATEARDWGRAGDLYVRRAILWERVKSLDPPLCEITYRPDEPPKVVFFRSPTEAEEDELREKLGAFEAVEELIAVS
jgi:transcriptional regulator with XRE-family HTH domain